MSTRASDEVASAVGRAVRAARSRAGLTLSEVAKRSNVTQAFLSQVEHGRTMPSLLSLHRIADALGVSAQALLVDRDEEVSLVRAGEGRRYERSERAGAVLERFLADGRHLMEPAEVWAAAGADSGEPVSHAGEELLFVLEGRLAVVLGEDPEVELAGGDCFYYPAPLPHRWRVLGDAAARFLVIATPASF